MQRNRIGAACAAIVVVSACGGNPTAVEYQEQPASPAVVMVTLDTVSAEMVLDNGHARITFEFPMAITNIGPDTLRRSRCATHLEALMNGSWVWHLPGRGTTV